MKIEKSLYKFNKNQKMMIISIIAFFCTILTSTYAWITSNLFDSDNSMIITSSSISLIYRGTSSEILADIEIGESVEKTFQVSNNSSEITSYNLLWKDVENTFVDKNYLKYTLINIDTNEEIILPRYLPNDGGIIQTNITIPASSVHRYKLIITYVVDPMYNQTRNVDSYFKGDIFISQGTPTLNNHINAYIRSTYYYAEKVQDVNLFDLTNYYIDNSRGYCTNGSSIVINNGVFQINNPTPSTYCEVHISTINTSILFENSPYNLLVIDPNGGEVRVDNTGYYYYTDTINLETPIKNSYSFVGWEVTGNETSINNNIINMGTTYSYAKAIWQEPIILTLNVNGGIPWNSTTCNGPGLIFDNTTGLFSTTCTKTIMNNSLYGTLPTPTKSNYTFVGWYTVATTSGGTFVTSSTTVTTSSSHTLYARWVANSGPVTQ